MLRHVGSGFPNFPRQVCPALVRARQVQIGSINYIRPQCRILREYALLDSFGSQGVWQSFSFPSSNIASSTVFRVLYTLVKC